MLRLCFFALALFPVAALADPFDLPAQMQVGSLEQPAPTVLKPAALCLPEPKVVGGWIGGSFAFKRAYILNGEALSAPPSQTPVSGEGEEIARDFSD